MFQKAFLALTFILAITLNAKVIVNEIVYKEGPDFLSGDWVELFNDSSTPVDISNWQIKDSKDDNVYTIPSGQIIAGYGYLVVYSKAEFTSVYPTVVDAVGPSELGFKKDEEVRIFDDLGEKESDVDYDCGVDGWPNVDGNNHSLALIYPYEDGDLGVNWASSQVLGGTPGYKNTGAVGIEVDSHSRLPNAPDDTDLVGIVLQVNDAFATITAAVINISIDGLAFTPYTMQTSEVGKYTYEISAKSNTTVVEYYFDIYNDAGQSLQKWWVSPDQAYLYQVDNNPINTGLIINEIMYNSSNLWISGGNTGSYEYLEIYNSLSVEVDLSYWRFEDSGNKFRLAQGTILPAENYLVITDSTQAVISVYGPQPLNSVFYELAELGLSNGGEALDLQNANGQKVDSVDYSDTFPWPTTPDGEGPSLELIYWTLDNTLPESWLASEEFGTPGAANSVIPEPVMFNLLLLALLIYKR